MKPKSMTRRLALGINFGLSILVTLGPLLWVAQPQAQPAPAPPVADFRGPIFLVPNFHPASCGWLTDFSTERVYCANSYLAHLDRVRDDPRYVFALSEVNNQIAIMNFAPERVAELKQRIQEGRVELVNAFFLEPTINLSGGEALIKMGIEGLRWQQEIFGVRPRSAWCIDVTGVHEQMGQIVSQLGLEAMVYTRDNPTPQTLHWLESPDGSRVLAISPGHYSDWGVLFTATQPLNEAALKGLLEDARSKAQRTPAGAPVLVLGGGGDYSLPPARTDYPSEFLKQWSQFAPNIPLRFATLSAYLDAVLPSLLSGQMTIPTNRSGAPLTWSSFWIQNPRVKTSYRRAEHSLQASEALSALASLQTILAYPSKPLYRAWIQMLLNMDRNTLWGAAGGMVFEHPQSWDAQDRFQSVETIAAETSEIAMFALFGHGQQAGAFNPLNWRRADPIHWTLPTNTCFAGSVCQADPEGRVIGHADLPSLGVAGLKLRNEPAPPGRLVKLPALIQTAYYQARLDPESGALISLKLKQSGREILGGPVLLVAEQGKDGHETPVRSQRKLLGDTSRLKARIRTWDGPVATIVQAESKFYGGGDCKQTTFFFKTHPRIDFETELNDVPNQTVVLVEFPLADRIKEMRRGIPAGFSHGAWATPNPRLAGWTNGIQAAIRWSHYQSARGGFALLDRGLPGRELNDRTPVLFLMNAQDKYLGYDCPWLSGKGRHRFEYALVAHDGDWKQARIPQMAWEFNAPPVVVRQVGESAPCSLASTSDNVIVEAVRLDEDDLELRLVECLGEPGTATVSVQVPHHGCARTDLVGGHRQALEGGPQYQFPVRPQEIVTLRLRTDEAVEPIRPLLRWDELAPKAKRPALRNYSKDLKGHPPMGDAPPKPKLPADSASSHTLGKPASASNVYRQMAAHAAGMATDGDGQTRWAADAGVHQAWLEIDLGAPREIGRAYLSEAYDRVQEFELQYRKEDRWVTVASGGKIGTNCELQFKPVTAQVARLNILNATDGPTIWEFELFPPK